MTDKEKEMWKDDLKFIEKLRTENETLKSQNDNYKKIIGKALGKINNMFEAGDEYKIVDNLLKLSEILKENKELKKQLHDASIQIQELIEKDIWCPSNCEKLKELRKQYCERIDCSGRIGNSKKVEESQQENKKLKEVINKAIKYIEKNSKTNPNLSGLLVGEEIDKLLEILKGDSNERR